MGWACPKARRSQLPIQDQPPDFSSTDEAAAHEEWQGREEAIANARGELEADDWSNGEPPRASSEPSESPMAAC